MLTQKYYWKLEIYIKNIKVLQLLPIKIYHFLLIRVRSLDY